MVDNTVDNKVDKDNLRPLDPLAATLKSMPQLTGLTGLLYHCIIVKLYYFDYIFLLISCYQCYLLTESGELVYTDNWLTGQSPCGLAKDMAQKTKEDCKQVTG